MRKDYFKTKLLKVNLLQNKVNRCQLNHCPNCPAVIEFLRHYLPKESNSLFFHQVDIWKLWTNRIKLDLVIVSMLLKILMLDSLVVFFDFRSCEMGIQNLKSLFCSLQNCEAWKFKFDQRSSLTQWSTGCLIVGHITVFKLFILLVE